MTQGKGKQEGIVNKLLTNIPFQQSLNGLLTWLIGVPFQDGKAAILRAVQDFRYSRCPRCSDGRTSRFLLKLRMLRMQDTEGVSGNTPIKL